MLTIFISIVNIYLKGKPVNVNETNEKTFQAQVL